jgi:sulfoxide reductase catalytic subunit YedY
MAGRRGWEIAEHEVTPEAAFLDRRRLLGGIGSLIGAAALGGIGPARADGGLDGRLPAPRNAALSAGETSTPEAIVGAYNNFYEFGLTKSIAAASQKLRPRPWRIVVDGLCDHPFEIDVDDLLKKVSLEERIYRHRCVEAWSMVVPWTGFPLAELVAMAGPKPEAKYLRMETFLDPKVAPYQSAAQYPWPYVEGLTLAEATHELAFLAVGAYGRPMPNQNGAPLRLVVPWKYGFKSVKSIVRFGFVARRPETFWAALGPSEYGFWANVNPEVPHPRWSQRSERRLGSDETVPTRLFNGYAPEVAGLYAGLGREKLFM